MEELKGYPDRGRLRPEAVRQAAEIIKLLGGTPPGDPMQYVDASVWSKAFGR